MFCLFGLFSNILGKENTSAYGHADSISMPTYIITRYCQIYLIVRHVSYENTSASKQTTFTATAILLLQQDYLQNVTSSCKTFFFLISHDFDY